MPQRLSLPRIATIAFASVLLASCGGGRSGGGGTTPGSSPSLTPARPSGQAGYYWDQYHRSTLADITILPWLTDEVLQLLTDDHLEALASIVNGMLQYQPFPLVTVHDEFKAHPNNLNWMRWQYKEILAEIADSNVLDDLLSHIHKAPGQFNKLSFNLGDQIRDSNYALC